MLNRLKSDKANLSLAALAVVTIVLVVVGLVWDRHRQSNGTESAVPNTVDPIAPAVVITAIGDSYTGGSHMSNYSRNWPFVVASELYSAGTPIELSLAAEGGSGYVVPGLEGTTFAQRATETDPRSRVVLVFGSRNDIGTDAADAARITYDTVRSKAPDAKLIVIGPVWSSADVPAELYQVRDQVREVALSAGATWVDPLDEQWFFGQDPSLIGSDGIHPTDAGHMFLASKIRPLVERALSGASS